MINIITDIIMCLNSFCNHSLSWCILSQLIWAFFFFFLSSYKFLYWRDNTLTGLTPKLYRHPVVWKVWISKLTKKLHLQQGHILKDTFIKQDHLKSIRPWSKIVDQHLSHTLKVRFKTKKSPWKYSLTNKHKKTTFSFDFLPKANEPLNNNQINHVYKKNKIWH